LREESGLRVFENRILERIFWPHRQRIMEWKTLRNENLNDLYCLPNIVRVMKSRRMRWTEHVARRGREEAYTGFGGET
jgi:hypothetical protein